MENAAFNSDRCTGITARRSGGRSSSQLRYHAYLQTRSFCGIWRHCRTAGQKLHPRRTERATAIANAVGALSGHSPGELRVHGKHRRYTELCEPADLPSNDELEVGSLDSASTG